MTEVDGRELLKGLETQANSCLALIIDEHKTSPEGGAEVREAEDELGAFMTRVRSFADRPYCPPMQEAVHLQDLARHTWNQVAQRHCLPGAATLVALLRELAVYAYLIGNNYFASLPIRRNYFQHNPLEAERCIVMCLKTAKDLSCTSLPLLQEAESMLGYAADLYNLAECLVSPKLRCTGLEIDFARLSVSWNSARYEQAVQLACSLADKVATHHHPYREMLLQYIYVTALRWSALVVAQTNGEDRGETCLRQLLALSLRIQQAEKGGVDGAVSTIVWRQPHCPLYGVTLLQYAASCVRSEAYAEALQYGKAAFDKLQSLEPLMLQLRALAAMGRTQEALELFCHILADKTLDMQDLFNIAVLMADTAPALFADVMSAVHARYPASQSDAEGMTLYDEFTFRYTCLLLHVGSAAAIAELRSVLSGYGTTLRCTSAKSSVISYARYYFCSLWQLVEVDNLPQDLRLDCLFTALNFASAATEDEVDGVFVDLVQLAFQLIDTSTHDPQATEAPLSVSLLQRCLLCYEQYAALIRSVHGQRCYCQVVCCLANDDAVKKGAVAKLLSSFTQDSELPEACASLMCFLVHHDALALAAFIAQSLLRDALADKLDATDALLFAKVYAMGVLASETSPHVDGEAMLTMQVCSVLLRLPTDALPQVEWWWWCHFLWCTADTLVASALHTALQLADTATQLAWTHKLADTPAQYAELTKHVLFVLTCEFDCFAQGSAYLTCDTVRHYAELAAQRGGSDDETLAAREATTAVTVTLRLADVECQLRGLVEGSSEDMDAKIEAVREGVLGVCRLDQTCVDDLETLALALLGVAGRLRSVRLRQCAGDAEVAAMRRYLEQLIPSAASPSGGQDVCEVLLFCYKASHIASSTETQRETYDTLVRHLRFLFPRCDDEAKDGKVPQRSGPRRDEKDLADVKQRSESMLEYFAVEAWNTAVQQNALHARAEALFWRDAATELCACLHSTHPTRIAITNLAAKMPVL